MAAQKGILMLAEIGDGAGPEVFAAVGGGRAVALTMNNEQVDVTSADDTGRDRQLLAGAGIRSMSVTLEGVFKDDAGWALAEAAAADDTHDNWKLTLPDYKTYTGAFQVASLSASADHNNEVSFSMTLESAGTITPATL